MPSVEIGRLTINAPGLEPEQGRRLGELIASRLAEARWLPAGSTPSVRISLSQPGGTDVDRLAALIITEMQRRLS